MAQDRLRAGLDGHRRKAPGRARRRRLQHQDVHRRRPDPADAAGQARQGGASAISGWGASPAPRHRGECDHHPERVAIIDEAGSLTWERTHRRSNALARALPGRGRREGDGVAVMCRNHRCFIEATMACAKLGAVAPLPEHGLRRPAARRRGRARGARGADLRRGVRRAARRGARRAGSLQRFVAWAGRRTTSDDPTLDELIASDGDCDLDPPAESSRFVILTSGTTGTPKGAQRGQPDSARPAGGAVLEDPAAARRDGR